MANALPHAVPAQCPDPGRQVISMSRDGGPGMLMGELLTLRLHDPPVKTIVFNHSSLGMVKLEMLVEAMPEHETDHGPVDHAAIARAAGIEAIRVERPEDVVGGLKQALAHDGPFLVKGFALAAGRTVLDGGVGKILAPARANRRTIPRP